MNTNVPVEDEMQTEDELPKDEQKIIVMGASAGGFEAIKKLVSGFPPNLNASVFIVWHMAPDVQGIMPQVLNNLHTVFATNAIDNEPIKNNHIYVAPPDRHLLVENNRIRISRGPKENRFRPAIDPLFRSAAYAYGTRVIGVILSGALDDGTAGLWTIKEYGGIAVVQDPEDAEVSAMPLNAIHNVDIDYKVPVSEMAGLLIKLCTEPVPAKNKEVAVKENEKTKLEIRIAAEEESDARKIANFGEFSPYTCPECNGVLLKVMDGKNMRFRCHTGHAFSSDSLLASITENIEENLWKAIRSIDEDVMMLNHIGDHFAEMNEPKLAAAYFKKAREAERRMQIVRQVVSGHEHLSTESINRQANNNNVPEDGMSVKS